MALVDAILPKCTSLVHIKQLQAHTIVSGLFQSHASSRTKLLELTALSSPQTLDYALAIFHAIHAPSTNEWNALVRGLAQSSEPTRAICFYLSMSRHERCRPDALTCSFALKACARALALVEGRQLHALSLRFGFEADVRLQTTLVDLYAKVGALDDAQQVFDEMPLRDVPTWNALIAGLAQASRCADALALFSRMQVDGVRPNEITVVAALSACSQMGALGEGRSVHLYANDVGLGSNLRVCNALIDMYAKCGSVEAACQVFGGMAERSLVSWNTMIMGLALHGHGTRALELFEQMGRSGTKPDDVTYLALLCACNHAGLVEDGLSLFRKMQESGVACNVKHYGCVVDLLGRAGRLQEAYSVIELMPLKHDAVLWQSLLGACKTYGDVVLAELAAQKLAEMGSHNCGDYVLMSNVYAAHQQWENVVQVREVMRISDVRKIPGFSFIKVGGVIHKFLNGDRSHSNSKEIYGILEEIGIKIKVFGYVPRTDFVLHDIAEEEKENALFSHSEKLAVAYGLISMDNRTPIQVIKNLRICGDCHLVIKLVSKAYDREIIVRDRARFHRFQNGSCSCGDYW